MGKEEANYESGFKHSSKCASIYNSTVLQTVAAKSFIDNRFLQHALKRHTQLENLTSDSLRVVPMQCNTSAMCSASGDSESQIRPTLTGKRITNQSIKLSCNQSNYHAINQSNYHAINQSIKLSCNQSIKLSCNQSIKLSCNQSINQITMQSINQIIMQSINQIIMQSINQIIMQSIKLSCNQSNYHAINQSVIDSSYQPSNQFQSNNEITNIRAIQKKTLYLNFVLAIRTLEQNKGYNAIGTVYLETQNNFVT